MTTVFEHIKTLIFKELGDITDQCLVNVSYASGMVQLDVIRGEQHSWERKFIAESSLWTFNDLTETIKSLVDKVRNPPVDVTVKVVFDEEAQQQVMGSISKVDAALQIMLNKLPEEAFTEELTKAIQEYETNLVRLGKTSKMERLNP